ncbi:MAG: ribosomal protein [Chlamydiota bacterium]|jgi:large subunit ribosomal protein L24
MSKWIRKGDKVCVIAGNDKGKFGEVLARLDERVVVQGVNVRKKHLKKTQETQGGRIVEMEKSIHISNVALCDVEGKAFKVKVRVDETGAKDLVYARGKEKVVHRSLKKGS